MPPARPRHPSPPRAGTYTLWDPYPDRDASSTWAKAVDACATQLGITIKRTASNTGDTVKDLTTAASNLPDIAMVDNPKVSTLADAGLLTTTEAERISTSRSISKNILSAGEIDGKVYGVPVGANTLGLYYNPTVLDGGRRRHRQREGLGVAERPRCRRSSRRARRASPSRPSEPKRAASSSSRGSGARRPT